MCAFESLSGCRVRSISWAQSASSHPHRKSKLTKCPPRRLEIDCQKAPHADLPGQLCPPGQHAQSTVLSGSQIPETQLALSKCDWTRNPHRRAKLCLLHCFIYSVRVDMKLDQKASLKPLQNPEGRAFLQPSQASEIRAFRALSTTSGTEPTAGDFPKYGVLLLWGVPIRTRRGLLFGRYAVSGSPRFLEKFPADCVWPGAGVGPSSGSSGYFQSTSCPPPPLAKAKKLDLGSSLAF